MEKRTIAGWCHYLNGPDAEFTLSEFMAKCLLDIRDNAVLSRLAGEHVEGMLGAIDDMCSRMDEHYARDGAVRAALDAARDARRDEQRALTGSTP
jgi:hypothetical protein